MNAGLLLLAIAGVALLAAPGAARALSVASSVANVTAPSSGNGRWRLPAAAAPYAVAILEAEARYNLPHLLLGRTLYQESRFRPEIISGELPSYRGAIGIAQLMPDTAAELGVNPYDPFESIDGAAMYLASLYDQFGDWTTALAAYNWGMGNVRRKGTSALPAESLAYANDILTDLGTFA